MLYVYELTTVNKSALVILTLTQSSRFIFELMGCLFSKRKFVVNPKVPGQDATAVEVFQTLTLAEKDVDLLFTAFWDIDADGSGSIRPIELFSYFNIELGQFEKHIFSVFDEDKSGVLNFMEFVCAMWNFLTLSERDLGTLTYLMKDPTGAMRIKSHDVKELLEILHKRKVDSSPTLTMLYNGLKSQYSGEISLQDFCKWTSANNSVLTPLVILQFKLRKQIIGERYWLKLTKEREEHPELGRHDFIKKLQATIKLKNDAWKQKAFLDEAEAKRLQRRGRGPNGDTRSEVARKESILLGVFNLKQPSKKKVVATTTNTDSEIDSPAFSNTGTSATASPSKKESSKGGSKKEKSRDSSASATGEGPVRRRRSIVKPSLTRDDKSKKNKSNS